MSPSAKVYETKENRGSRV